MTPYTCHVRRVYVVDFRSETMLFKSAQKSFLQNLHWRLGGQLKVLQIMCIGLQRCAYQSDVA